jgi:hypothetical protein
MIRMGTVTATPTTIGLTPSPLPPAAATAVVGELALVALGEPLWLIMADGVADDSEEGAAEAVAAVVLGVELGDREGVVDSDAIAEVAAGAELVGVLELEGAVDTAAVGVVVAVALLVEDGVDEDNVVVGVGVRA